MFIYFLKTVQSYFFTEIFRITLTITYSKTLHSLRTSAESFLVILGLILAVFLYLLRSVKPILIKACEDVFCITAMLTALKAFSQKALSWRLFYVIFWSVLWYFSWKPFNMFHEIFQRYSWFYCGNHTKNNMACCLHFARLFWIILGHIFAPVRSQFLHFRSFILCKIIFSVV